MPDPRMFGGPTEENQQSPEMRMIQELMASLETAPAPPVQAEPVVPPWQKVLFGGTPRNFVGNLGDAISAMAAVRAGGAPPQMGGYAAGKAREAEAARELAAQQSASAEADRRARNQLRGQFGLQELEGQQRLEQVQAKPTAGSRLLKSEFARDVNGTSRKFVRFTNPQTGEVVAVPNPETGELEYEHDLGPTGYAPTVIPGMVEGKTGVYRVPRNTGPATEVTGPGGAKMEPPPPPGLASEAGGKIGVLKGVPHLMDVYKSTDTKLRGSGKIDQLKNWAYAQTAGTRVQPIVMPKDMQIYYNEMRAILTPYVRSVSGLVFPESELRRYESRMPIPGVTDAEVVEGQWDSLIQEMVRDIKAKYGAVGRTPPAIPDVQAKPEVDPAVQEYEDYLKSLRGEANAPTQ